MEFLAGQAAEEGDRAAVVGSAAEARVGLCLVEMRLHSYSQSVGNTSFITNTNSTIILIIMNSNMNT